MVKMLEVNALVLANGMTVENGKESESFGTVVRILSPHQDADSYQVLFYGVKVSYIDEST